MDIIGRKRSLQLLTFPSFIGWILIIKSTQIWMMIVGRIFLGISLAASYVLGPVYIAEISAKEIRGTLGAMYEFNIAMGMLISYSLGAYLEVYLFSVVCGLFPLIFEAMMYFMPESPTFLVKKKRVEEAEMSLKWLRGNNLSDIQLEIKEIKQEQEEFSVHNQRESLLESIKKKESIKALIIVLGLSAFEELCGINAVSFYTSDIFGAVETSMSPDLQSIFLRVMELLMSIVSAITVDRWGRKTLLILSGILMGICLIVLGTFFIVQNHFSSETLMSLQWIPVASLSLYIVGYALGFGSVCFLMRGEICSTKIKGNFS